MTDVAWTFAALIAALLLWRAGRDASAWQRTAWRLLAAAAVAWLLGQMVWNWYELVRKTAVPIPNIGDYGYCAFGLLCIAGLFALRATLPVRRLTPERIANMGLIFCSLAVALVGMVLEPMTRARHTPYFLGVLAVESILIMAAFVVAVYFTWSYRWGSSLRPMVLLALGLAVHTFCALVYASNLILDRYDATSAINIGWLIAFGLMSWAAAEQIELGRARSRGVEDRYIGEGWIEALVPSILLFILACSAMSFIDLISARVVLLNASLLAIFAGLLAFRETWLYSQGLHLQASLRESSSELQATRARLQRTAAERLALERDVSFATRAGGIGLWDWDLRTNQIQFSQEWKRQLGYDHELADELEEWQRRIHPDDAHAVQSALQRALHDPGNEYRAEMRLRHRDGSYRWILSQGTVLVDEAGRPMRMRGVHVDISASKQLEEALRQSEARYREIAGDLERRVAQRTAALREAYRESQSFAYAVAHDLKAPLRAIDGFSHLLQESAAARLSETEREYIDRVRRGAIQMELLIEDLLAYSRMEHREVRIGSVELSALVAEFMQGVRETCSRRERVCADREGLGVVLRNIVENALKFTRNRPEPRIEIGVRVEEHVAVLWVKDNGVGFDPSYSDKIFEIFQRLHRIDEYEGTGIGLALARKAMQRMHGCIWAEAALGVGATFFIQLPLLERNGCAPAAESIAPAPMESRS